MSFPTTVAAVPVTAPAEEANAERPCECGKGIATLSLPIGSPNPRWCAECPNKPWNAIKRCECRRKKARFGMPGQDLKEARWCADCPNKHADAIDLEAAAAAARAASAKAADAARFEQEAEKPKPCACGKGVATLALPIQPKLARWCPECPDRPRNAIPVAGRCQCGRRKAYLGMPGTGPAGAKWCEYCPDKPAGIVALVDLTPLKTDNEPKGRYSKPLPEPVEPGPCVCGKETATLALPIQLWLPKWCPSCPERPRNAVNVKFRCECGRRKATLGLPGMEPKWCAHCPDKPENAVTNPLKAAPVADKTPVEPGTDAPLPPPAAVPGSGSEAAAAPGAGMPVETLLNVPNVVGKKRPLS